MVLGLGIAMEIWYSGSKDFLLDKIRIRQKDTGSESGKVGGIL